MTFEGFDAAPLIEGAGFSPILLGGATVLMAGADGTLEAALQAAGAGPRAALDAHDLWALRAGGHAADIFERSGASWRGWLEHGDAEHGAHATKDVVLRAALWDDVDGDGEEDDPITVTGTRNVNGGTGDGDGGGYGGGFYPGTTGYEGDMSAGGSLSRQPHKVADHTQDCGTEDGAAVQVAKHVMGTPPAAGPPNPITSGGSDWTHIEYGAVIVRHPDGSYGALNDAIYSSGNSNYVDLPNATGTDAVGLWHVHAGGDRSADQQLIDRYPSSTDYGGGDWGALQRFHDEVAPGNPSFDPSLWLTGPDGITREFKLSERSNYEHLTPEQMKASEGLAGKERTQSCG